MDDVLSRSETALLSLRSLSYKLKSASVMTPSGRNGSFGWALLARS